jgi:tRNA threonylcarbamoyl adenosine modification protein YeaZ
VLVLALDTSTPTVTAGVVRLKRPHELLAEAQSRLSGDADATSRPYRVLAERTVTDAFGHAEHLMPLVGAALAEAGSGIDELEAVVVGIGPGPFTGLRVGMVTAAALGDARDIPVHAVASHDAMARRRPADQDGRQFLVVTDARRREVYLSAYRGPGTRRHGPEVIAPAGIADLLSGAGLSPAFVTGAGATLVADALGLPVREPVEPLSGALVECALRPLLTGAVPGPLSPLYLRRPDATEPAGPKPVLPAGEPSGPSEGRR